MLNYIVCIKGGKAVKNSSKGVAFLFFIIILGGVFGSIIGEFVGNNIQSLYFLKTVYNIGTTAPLTINLKFFSISFGINFSLNIMSIIGIILAIILYRRY